MTSKIMVRNKLKVPSKMFLKEFPMYQVAVNRRVIQKINEIIDYLKEDRCR